MRFLFNLLPLLLLLIGAGQSFAQDHKLNRYQVIGDKEANLFLSEARSYVQLLYGAPQIPIQTVTIRFCPEASPFTNLTDAKKGEFTICLTRQSDEYAFYGQLAHEAAHLLNARLFDAYAEGLCTLFSRQMLEKAGKDWSGWESHYKKGGDPFYAATYFMMSEVSEAVGASHIKTLLSFAESDAHHNEKMHIDIKGWIKSLPAARQEQIKEIILKHAGSVQKTMTGSKQNYSFILPK